MAEEVGRGAENGIKVKIFISTEGGWSRVGVPRGL